MHIVIFTGGNFTPSQISEKAIKEADIIIAADSGADTALHNGIYPSVVVGDMDSIHEATKHILEARGTKFVDMTTTLASLPAGSTKPLNASEKDQTDTELAINYAIQEGATKITIFGGIAGDRFDHIMGNLFLPLQYTIPIYFIQHNQVSWVLRGPTQEVFQAKKGDLLSLIPLQQDVKDITTESLYYPLHNDTLRIGSPRGISNICTGEKVSISFTKGILLLVHTDTDMQ